MQTFADAIPDGVPTDLRFSRLMVVGSGGGREVYARMLGEGFDAILAEAVVYGIAEGFSREAGNPEGDPARFHDGQDRNAGADLPDGLCPETLGDRARDAMNDPRMFDGMTLDRIEEVALLIGADLHRDLSHAPAP